ncbi:MBL fold metallo-hydrolase [candidate division WOR-3 bacterium]|nr:MBL fold metallo-hydrolase [candidate division WOR-3 bacterium]
MILKVVTVGEMQTNCYILGCKGIGHAIIIDPGDDYPRIVNCLKESNLEAKLIVNTHGHIDHIGTNGKFALPIWIHELDADYLIDPSKNLSDFWGKATISPPASHLLKDRDSIKIGELTLTVIHTPGHTPGGICLKTDNIIFTGDTLFCGGIGRTDFPGASEKILLNSIRERLLVLDDDMIIYPGHGLPSTIGEEKRKNPYLNK